MCQAADTPLSAAHQQHDRHWRRYAYCYPVVSRRSGGLSIGINLNPDKVCNFDCVYCQVDRTESAEVRKVDLAVLKGELESLLDAAVNQSLFAQPPFDCLGPNERHIRDIAFSGDGEPTVFPRFEEAVRIAADTKLAHNLRDTKLVLMTNGSALTKPKVRTALRLFDESNGEIWVKLDAGTQAHFEMVNRPNHPLSHVMKNIIDTARVRPIVIQSLWMRSHDRQPPESEVRAFADRLNEIMSAGGQIKCVQIYTVARRTAETHITALSRNELNHVAAIIRDATAAPIKTYHGAGG